MSHEAPHEHEPAVAEAPSDEDILIFYRQELQLRLKEVSERRADIEAAHKQVILERIQFAEFFEDYVHEYGIDAARAVDDSFDERIWQLSIQLTHACNEYNELIKEVMKSNLDYRKQGVNTWHISGRMYAMGMPDTKEEVVPTEPQPQLVGEPVQQVDGELQSVA